MLWKLKDDYFSTPLDVQIMGDYAVSVKISNVPLIQLHLLASRERLKAFSYRQENDAYYMTPETLAQIASPMRDNDDPENAVMWNPIPHQPVIGKENLYKMKEFYQAMTTRGISQSENSAKFLYARLMNLMRDWLLSGNEVQLGFASIRALPYRKNWLACLTKMDSERCDSRIFMKEGHMQGRLKWLFMHENLFALGKNNTIYWTLTITETQFWTKPLLERELKRKEHPFYYSQIIDWLALHLEEIFYHYYEHAKEMYKKVCKLPFCVAAKRTVVMQEKEAAMSEFDFDSSSIPPTILHLWGKQDPCHTPDLHEEINGMPPLPVLQPEEENVRDSGDDLQQ